MEQEISVKSTKAQIIDAYEKLLERVKKMKSEVPKQVQEEKQRSEKVAQVAKVTEKGIVSEIAGLKSKVDSSLDEMEKNLMDEFNKLEEIREAITIEKKNLEDLYSLSSTTDSLAAMILAQKEQKESFETEMKVVKETFEQEMAGLREQWKLEKEKQIVEQKEYIEVHNKNRKREEEEYQYKLKIEHQKDTDSFETHKAKLEKELSEKKLAFEQEMAIREADIKNAEQELNELRKNNEEAPKKLEKALADKEKEITARLTSQFEFESKLLAKQNEGEIKLKDQTITSLKEKITEMQKLVKELTDKANNAESNVKDIAVKAIESSSKIQVFPTKEKEEN